jgi:hypothetical protein
MIGQRVCMIKEKKQKRAE